MKINEIHDLEKKLNLPKNKIKNFFKNERLKDFKNAKTFVKNLRNYKLFNKEDKNILEQEFRQNQNLDGKTLKKL